MFVEKVRDIVGLYLNPPIKPSCFVSMRRARLKPWSAANPFAPASRLPERQTHDYVRHGTLLCLPLTTRPPDASWADVTSVTVTRNSWPFWNVRRGVPDDGQSQLHLIIDNYSTHKTLKVYRWLLRHPAFIFTSLPLAVLAQHGRRFFARILQGYLAGEAGATPAPLIHSEHNRTKPYLDCLADSIFRKLENSLS
jgi:hypothetical protein